MYRFKHKERTVNFNNKLVKVTDEVLYDDEHPLVLKFKSHFKKENDTRILNEQPVEDAKVIQEDENVSTEVVTENAVITEEVNTDVEETEVVTEEVNTDESKNDSEDETVVSEGYESLETKEELVQYIEDNQIDVSLGNTKNPDKIKEKIKIALEA